MGYRKRCNQAELARVLGCASPSLTKAKHDPSFPPFDADNQVEIYAGCVWWHKRQESATVAPAIADDELLVGTASDGLERYRLARAQQEEIKLAEQRGQIVKLDAFEEASQAILGPYRRLAEMAKRAGNQDMWQAIEEANAEVLSGLEKLYAHDDAATSDSVE